MPGTVPSPHTPGFFEFLAHPIPEAKAAAADCPPLTSATCVDIDPAITGAESLVLNYDHCQTQSLQKPAYWQTHVVLKFTSAALCADMQGSDFSNVTALSNFVSNAPAFNDRILIARGYGLGGNGDQTAFRVSQNGVIFQLSSEFRSGFADDQSNAAGTTVRETRGGYEVTFPTATTREIRLKGLHAFGRKGQGLPEDSAGFDSLIGDFPNLSTAMDVSLNTYYKGDTYYVSQGKNTTPITEGSERVLKITGVGPNRVVTDGAIRTQDNLHSTVARTTIKTALTYTDSTCCYPTSGTIHTDFDPHFKRPWVWEEVEFTSSCGKVFYRTQDDPGATDGGRQVSTELYHCF